MKFTEEHLAVAELTREIAQREIAPHSAQWNRDRHFPRHVFTLLAQAGIMGLRVPEAYGGIGSDYVSYALAIEELSRVDAGVGVTVSVHAMVTNAIAILGTPTQQEQYLPGLASGDIAAFALTEPEVGSDAAHLASRASAMENGWTIRGRKQWCTNGTYASVIMGMFRTGDAGAGGISAFLIPRDAAGVVVERETDKLGIHTSNTCDLAFDDVLLPQDALLGSLGMGYTSALQSLAGGRIGIAAQACGILAASLDAAILFARERKAFGKPIGAFEGVSFKIAQMATKLEAARLLTYQAAAQADAGEPFATAAAMAKLFASRAACEGASDALQIHGGYGYTNEFAVERYYRDAKITEIYEGTSEVLQLVIGRSLLGPLTGASS